jgi:aerobic-type carbon monoxide dehydrogenase small subunit (CoxS/CutS family)
VTRRDINLTVNRRSIELSVEPRRSLVDVLREDLELTGTHVGCEHGVCGACTVLVDGEPIRACLMLGVQADGHEIDTIEGLEQDGVQHPLQVAFRDCHSFQCGFCTPGFMMTAVALLAEGAVLDETQLREELSGCICRCTGYQSIVDGVMRAMVQAKEAP